MRVVEDLEGSPSSWFLKMLRTPMATEMPVIFKERRPEYSPPRRLWYIIYLLEPRARGDGVINVDLMFHLVAT